MKKIFTFLAASALVVLAASCAKEQQIAAVPAGEETTVEFTVATPELMTKAIADGNTVDKVSCNVYGTDGLIADLSKTIDMAGGKTTFSVRLVTGQTYSFLFWAYDKDGSAYTLDADAKTVAVSYDNAASNDESRDAFYAYVADKKITSSVTETVTLKRPFAQVNFGVEPDDIKAAKTAGYTVAKSSVKITGLANVLNLTDGTVSGTVDADFTIAALPADTEKLTVNTKDYNYVATNYVLVGADKKQLSDVELKIYDATSTEPINTISVPNVPLQGNYRTNILGNLFTSSVNYNIVVNPDFDDPDYEKEIWDGATVNEPSQDANGNYLITKASELAWVAQQTNAGTTFAGKTVLLTEDIDLNNQPWTPIGTATDAHVFQGMFDGQNHTITNLYIRSSVSEACLGLFGFVYTNYNDGATGIKNLVIDGAEVVSEVTAAGCGAAAGLFSGHAVADNVKVVNATVKNSHYVGGIAGQAWGYFRNCSVESTEVVAFIALKSDNTSYDYGDKAGGIVGQFCEGARDITNCHAKDVKITGYRDLGGIVGMAHNNTTVEGCSVENITITIDNTHNYNEIAATADAHNVHAVIGRKGTNQTDTNNTGTATINYAGTATTQAELDNLIGIENATITLADGTYTLPGSAADGITIKGESKDAVIEANTSVTWGGKTAKFENLTYKNSDGNYVGIQHSASISYKDCVIEGKPTMYATTATFDNCTFKQSSYEYCIWTYGSENITFTNCTFDTMGKAVKVYHEGAAGSQTATFDGCTFKATNVPEGNGKAAVEIDGTLLKGGKVFNVVINNCTESGFVAGENSKNTMWNCDLNSIATVTVDGTVVYNNK